MVASTDRLGISRRTYSPSIGGTKRGRPDCRNQADFDKSPEWCLLGRQPPAHYQAVAARARRLQTEATTPRLKQYLEEMIAQCERLVGEVEEQLGNGANQVWR
jgi:hypothetical protein